MKVARKNEKKFGSWSQRAQTLNEKLRRCKAALFLRLSPNRRNNPTRRKKFARVENFRRSTTRKLLKKMKKNLGLGPNVRRRLTKNSGDAGLHYFSVISLNRRNNPAWQKVFARVENFRRSTTRKLLGIIFKIFRRWSQRGQTLNEKLRRNFFLARLGYFSVISLG